MSTEHDVYVARIGAIVKHPNADTLSITEIDGRPVILRTGEYAEGDLAVYLPVDTMVPLDDPRFAFLRERNFTTDGYSRIKAVRLRGVFSMGLLAKPEPGWVVGQRVEAELRTRVYEPAADLTTGGDNEPDPGHMPCYTDIESYRKWRRVFTLDENVVCTEKIHGANARYVFANGRLWCGSRTGIKKDDPRSIWWNAARGADLAAKLATVPDVVLYGEVYGQVQDLKYGVSSGVRFVAFDAMHAKTRTYFDYADFAALTDRLDVPRVPVLYRGPLSALDSAIANGKSVLASGACIREGFVMRPEHERFDPGLGRVIVKLVGEDYHTRKGA